MNWTPFTSINQINNLANTTNLFFFVDWIPRGKNVIVGHFEPRDDRMLELKQVCNSAVCKVTVQYSITYSIYCIYIRSPNFYVILEISELVRTFRPCYS